MNHSSTNTDDGTLLLELGYSRTSGDEAGTGQDAKAQAAQLRVDVAGLVEVFVDDGVSGSAHPLGRPGFLRLLERAADQPVRVWVRDLKRVGRMHPVVMAAFLDDMARRGVVFAFTNDRDLPEVRVEEQDSMAAAELFMRTWMPWAELVSGRNTTRKAMEAFTHGDLALRRPTKSGKPVGRPQKVSDDEARAWHPVAVEVGAVDAARRLSIEKGWRPDQDPRTQKKYRVGHSTLIGAFGRVGLPWPCVRNPDASETVSDVQGAACIDKGSLSDGVGPAPLEVPELVWGVRS